MLESVATRNLWGQIWGQSCYKRRESKERRIIIIEGAVVNS